MIRFRKRMENIRNCINFKLVTNEDKLQKKVNKPTLKEMKTFDENLSGVPLMKGKIILNKPIYIGQAILDLSKMLMYDFMYNYVFKKRKVENVNVCMTDTNSLLLEIKIDDVYKGISTDVYFIFIFKYKINKVIIIENFIVKHESRK